MKTRYKVWREAGMEGGDRIKDLTTAKLDNDLLLDDIHVGDEFLVMETCNEMRPKESSKFTLFRTNKGLGGNLNGSVKRYHGWRGTSYDVATYALGVHKVISISEVHTERQEQEQFVQRYEAYMPVTVTGHWAYVTIDEEDAHPDWE